jgi:hypothetical protein
VAPSGESLGRLFVELGLADEAFLSGVKNALTEVGRLKDGVVKAGKVAAEGVKPLATAFINVSEAEKRAVAQTVAATATEQARAKALGITTAQVRELDRAQRAAADSAAKQAAATQAAAKAEAAAAASASANAAAITAAAKARMTVAGGLAADRSARGDTRFGTVEGGGVQVVPPGGTGQQVAQLAALGVAVAGVTTSLKESVLASSQYNNAFLGLRSVARAFSEDEDRAVKAAEALAADGLLPAAAAAQGFKNALASGYSIEESIKLLSGLKEQAIFNRQAHYDLGGAIIATTEGIKNEQSILADATGTTTNLSQMWKVYAEQLGKAPGQLSAAEKRQAAYNGFLAETSRSAGDLAKAQETLAGTIARSETATKKAQVALGDALAPAYRAFIGTVTALAEAFTNIATRFPGLTAGIATAVVALGTMATALSAARTAALLFETSLGPVGIALAAISVAIGVGVAAYTAYADATKEAADAQDDLQRALSETGVEASLKRQALAMDALAAAERDLNDTQDGFSMASKKQVAVLKAKAEARRRDVIAANEAVRVEKDLADERERVGAQTTATEGAEKKLADLREENMSEPARLEAEMNRVLNSMSKATPDVLEGIREEYLKKIADAQSKAADKGESAAKKLQSQIDAAKKSVEELLELAASADQNVITSRAEAAGQDPAIAQLEARLREVGKLTQEAMDDALKITNVRARELAVAAVHTAGEAAKDAVIQEWTALGEIQAEAEYKAYQKAMLAKRQKTVDLLNKIDQSRMTESGVLAAERDSALLNATNATESERATITAYYNEQIAKADEDLKRKRLANAKAVRDAYANAFSDIVSRIDSAASSVMGRHKEQMDLVQAQLKAAEDGETTMTQAQKKALEERYQQQRSAYMRAFYVQKAAAIASIAVSTAQAAMATYAALAAVPPAAIAAAIAVGALGAAQIAIVATEQPQFEKGGMVTMQDRLKSPGTARGASVNADLHVGEGVLTAGRGMQAIGGEAGLRLLNAGMPIGAVAGVTGGRVRGTASPPDMGAMGARAGGAGAAPTNVRVMLDGQVVDEVQIRRWDSGASKIQQRVYRSAGVRIGLDR